VIRSFRGTIETSAANPIKNAANLDAIWKRGGSMDINVRKWIPWNWFRNEEEHEGVPVRRSTGNVPERHDDPLAAVHHEIDRLFSRLLQPFEHATHGLPTRSPRLLLKPSVDIKEHARAYVVKLEVPGVDEQDVRVELHDRDLVITGEKKHESSGEDETYHWVECAYGTFRRVLTLPADAREDGIEARFRRGVLTITIPREAGARTDQRRIIDVQRD
jgi:HSP20 family protein